MRVLSKGAALAGGVGTGQEDAQDGERLQLRLVKAEVVEDGWGGTSAFAPLE